MIPRILIRTVPAETTDQVEGWWDRACELHPTWEHITYRDPIDPDLFPITSPHWDRCTSGAQRAGLIRLEALYRHGGVYIDSDVELYRPLTPLLGLDAFAAWEDDKVVPDAVLGAHAKHDAIADCLTIAVAHLELGAWVSGPGVTTDMLQWRDDVLLLPPGSFYPWHYTQKHRRVVTTRTPDPWTFGAHHWHHSWA